MEQQQSTAVARIGKDDLVRLGEQRRPVGVVMHSFPEIVKMAGYLAHSGILGTHVESEVVALMLLSQAEGRNAMACKGRWWIWSDSKGVHTQRKANSLLADFQAAGGDYDIIESTDKRCELRGTFRGKTFTSVWDEAKVATAGLKDRATHKTSPAKMKFHRAAKDLVEMLAPSVVTGALAIDETIIEDDFVTGETADPKPLAPPKAEPKPPPAPVVDVASAVRKAASDNKAAWIPSGAKATAEDYAPAWTLISLRTGRVIGGPGDVVPEDLEEVSKVFALGKEDAAKEIVKERERAASATKNATATDAEFEPAASDDPFDIE